MKYDVAFITKLAQKIFLMRSNKSYKGHSIKSKSFSLRNGNSKPKKSVSIFLKMLIKCLKIFKTKRFLLNS